MKNLPQELKDLVRQATTDLGQAILDAEGIEFYQKIEKFRVSLTKMRSAESKRKFLNSFGRSLRRSRSVNQLKVAHAFSLYLEIINCCEAAYRTWRNRNSGPSSKKGLSRPEITFVLTSHPTESRSSEFITIIKLLTELLVETLNFRNQAVDIQTKSLIRLLWNQPLRKSQKPTVVEEAEHIFSILFDSELLEFILSRHEKFDLRFHTWVGGDKDGHPGVNATVMKNCLELSRARICSFLDMKLRRLEREIRGREKNKVQRLRAQLGKLRLIENRDGQKVAAWIQGLVGLKLKKNPQVSELFALTKLFPALVCPIELREDSALVAQAMKTPASAIRQMLIEMKKTSRGMKITNYVRGFVISHCESASDIDCAVALVGRYGDADIPIVPLFESNQALTGGPDILDRWLGQNKNLQLVKKSWEGVYQVMLGYSDSSKQVGVFPSRFLIAQVMQKIQSTIEAHGVSPLFFHGSGGSVDRGGGNLRDQLSWWSERALARPKVTMQGEMIQRQLATPDLFQSLCEHFARGLQESKKLSRFQSLSPSLNAFAMKTEGEYTKLVQSDRLAQLLSATPYKYLDLLAIGSRPTKRPSQKNISVESLRAIPWVLCWTQTRLLLPTWWGLGSSWKAASRQEKSRMKRLFKTSPFFSSFMKTLGFTLQKVDLEIWDHYAREAQVSDKLLKEVRSEFRLCLNFFEQVTGKKEFIWSRPWLTESIQLRAPLIDVLNLLQIIGMQNRDHDLLRETTAGIACGMMTTG